MKLNYLAFAVPLFLFFMGLEYWYAKRKGKNLFQFAESVANLNVGMAERLLDIFMTGVFFFVFDQIRKTVWLILYKGWSLYLVCAVLIDRSCMVLVPPPGTRDQFILGRACSASPE